MEKLNWYFSQLGAMYVFDTSFARDIALVAAGQEFIQRYRSSKSNLKNEEMRQLPVITSACPGLIVFTPCSFIF